MDDLGTQLLFLGIAGILLIVNGFFVAAEFALVKMRASRVEMLVEEGARFAKTLDWHTGRLDASLAACQLGITLASLGLGWVGEPALAGLLAKPLEYVGIGSPVVAHTISFVLGFSLFTALHITIGEQVPKIYAIRRPEPTALLCALPLKLFYLGSYPFLVALNATSNLMLSFFGIMAASGHDSPHTEDEIRHLLTESRSAGELTKTEHRLMNAVFDFDERICRQIFIPRKQVVMFDIDKDPAELLELIVASMHSRYPVYKESPDNVIGLFHVKDFAGKLLDKSSDLHEFVRPIERVPDTMTITKVLTKFQNTKVHMALVEDEHGTIVGAITLEDILEELVGSIQDEFDAEPELIRREANGVYVVKGSTPIDLINKIIGLNLENSISDTISGYIVDTLDRNPTVGDTVTLEEAFAAEVLATDSSRAIELKLTKL